MAGEAALASVLTVHARADAQFRTLRSCVAQHGSLRDRIQGNSYFLRMSSAGLGILSWHGYASLQNTLQSYADASLFDLFDRTLVFLPEATDEGIGIARRFGIEFVTHDRNVGILEGLKTLAERLPTDLLVLCENDYCLIEPGHEAARQLKVARDHIESGVADYYTLCQDPGAGFNVAKVAAYWPAEGATAVERCSAAIRRLARPNKARKMVGRTVFTRAGPPHWAFKHGLIRRTAEGTLIVSSASLNWWNFPSLVPRDFYLNTIIAEAEKRVRPGRGHRNGFPTIETELNCSWWREAGFKIGVGRGLFKHSRQGDRGY